MIKEAWGEIQKAEYERPLDTDGNIDPRVLGLVDSGVMQAGMKVLDIGTLDGYHACQLATFGAVVTASDIRPNNLKLALYRSLYHGITNMKFILLDMEQMRFKIYKDEYDIIFHSGCFYHLANPVEHLKLIAPLAKYILLETHVADGKDLIEIREGYFGYKHPEMGWSDPRSSKDNRNSFWLTTESLLKLFDESGLEIIKTVYEKLESEHGPRSCYVLHRRNNV